MSLPGLFSASTIAIVDIALPAASEIESPTTASTIAFGLRQRSDVLSETARHQLDAIKFKRLSLAYSAWGWIEASFITDDC